MSADFDLPFPVPPAGIADDNDRAHERPAESAEEGGASGIAADEAPRNGCLIIGPSQAGKTSLLLALDRACGLPHAGDPPMRFIPDHQTAELMRRAVRMMTRPNETMFATREAKDYGFTVSVAGSSVQVVMSDGPGGALFPEELPRSFGGNDFNMWLEQLLATARSAATIVLCVDAIRPRSDLWQEYLPQFVVGATQAEEAAGGGVAPRKLNASRVLVLLTKVDRLCEDAHVALNGDQGRFSHMVGALTPAGIAAMIDPVEQLRRVLGVNVLNTIHSPLTDGSSLAVGVCSAGGFRRDDGRPYWLANGKPNALDAETADEVLRSWEPFGIRDVLHYIVTGAGRGMVRVVTEKDLIDDGRRGTELTSVGMHQTAEGT